MTLGTIEAWVVATGQGLIRTPDGARFAFTAADLVGLTPADLRPGRTVAFEPGPGDAAARVHDPAAAAAPRPLGLAPDLPPDHPVFRRPPVPERVQELLSRCEAVHPGLRLDKYLAPVGNQEHQKDRLAQVAADAARAGAGFEAPAARRGAMLQALGAQTWTRTTSGPLTLHLSRSSMLENAGICLHPIHGFPFLPGTGLKGLARAFAETVWKPGQADPAGADAAIARIFGTASGADDAESSRAGSVIFHDAWPASWPRLVVDVINNHHASYYQDGEPPGDWESPRLVYFLAMPAGQRFGFALGARAGAPSASDRDQARSWLDGGLTHLGCGAKTAAGYGRFASPEAPGEPIAVPGRWAGEAVRLRLVTPAFLAGAAQGRDDCDLRPATLRGLLRWWWRTLHAGYLDVPTLRALEAALWGDTEAGAAIHLAVEAQGGRRVEAFAFKDRARPAPEFKRAHRLADPPDGRTTQGLFYASYGMDDKRGQPPRFYVEPGAWWMVRIRARVTRFAAVGQPIAPEVALDQARAALGLLDTFGGVGSKGRKGFGSLAGEAAAFPDLAGCEALARGLRQALGIDGPWQEDRARSPSLGERLGPLEIPTSWDDPWFALDQLGFAYQGFAQEYAHRPEKLALGLPRSIHGPRPQPMPHQDPHAHRPPQRLRTREGLDRHASPVHLHVGPGPAGLVLRVLALPSHRLPDRPTSRAFLAECLEHLRGDLEARARLHPGRPAARSQPQDAPRLAESATSRPAPPPPPAAPPPKPLNKGQQDRLGTFHHEGGRWAVRFEGDARPVTLTNPDKLPPGLAEGTKGLFYIAEANKAGVKARLDRLP